VVGLRLSMVALHRRIRGVPIGGPELLRQALQELGGAFVKFGQVLSLQVETVSTRVL
jgi:predicted unusual protein kinase regulating ubiquinone biosynthesis (AarF/ABC1/UbiB family)